jgi:hypothetical protein
MLGVPSTWDGEVTVKLLIWASVIEPDAGPRDAS